MRLITVDTNAGPRAAVEQDGYALLIPAANGTQAYADIGALLRAGPDGLAAARKVLEDGGERVLLDDDNRLRPVLEPGATVCVGLNYRSHIEEMGLDVPTNPTLFAKIPRALTDPFADIAMPPTSDAVDFEGELVAVIGTGGSSISAERAWDHVVGLTILNDVSMRDYQNRTRQWFAGKNFQASTPFGPAVVTLDEVDDIASLELRLTVNGKERQRAFLDQLVFDVPSLIADLSRIIDLEPGDLIATGTPGGVGAATKDFLSDGDVVEVSVDGLGSIRNTFRAAAPSE